MPSIKLSPAFQAFAQGVTAADQVRAELEQLIPEGTYDQRIAMFCLRIGQRAAAYAEQEAFDAFIAGAGSRQPERTGVLFELDTSGPTFNRHDPDAPGYDFGTDDAEFRFEVTKALTRTINEIADGADGGKLYDAQGRKIGQFRIIDS